jgi:hypothetical protein
VSLILIRGAEHLSFFRRSGTKNKSTAGPFPEFSPTFRAGLRIQCRDLVPSGANLVPRKCFFMAPNGDLWQRMAANDSRGLTGWNLVFKRVTE